MSTLGEKKDTQLQFHKIITLLVQSHLGAGFVPVHMKWMRGLAEYMMSVFLVNDIQKSLPLPLPLTPQQAAHLLYF